MLCVLVFVNFGHVFVQGKGNVLYKACYYDCSATAHWYNRIHRFYLWKAGQLKKIKRAYNKRFRKYNKEKIDE